MQAVSQMFDILKRPTWPFFKCLRKCHLPRVSVRRCVASGGTPSSQKKKKRAKSREHVGSPSLSWEEKLADTVTPLWRLNYEEQLRRKQDQQQRILLELSNQLTELSGVSCSLPGIPLLPIIPSPVKYHYRNKSTFSINKGVDGNPKTVGFYIGTGKGGNIVCVNGDHLLNIPEKHKLVARYYEDFIRQSPLEPCIVFHDGGHWREVTVRTNAAGNTMAIVYFHPQCLTTEEICTHKDALVEYFTKGPGSVCDVDSLYFQESVMTRCSHQQSPYQLLHGQPHIHEELLGYKFRISADAFFQVNRAAAESLYQTVGELSHTTGSDILLDVCSGTGAIGISMSSRVKKVIGIEIIEQAVEDAKYNAMLNKVSNCEFIVGKAEVVLPKLITSLGSVGGLTAVVNPSRAGLHYRVIKALRNHPCIHRLVYISCKPDGEAMRNFRDLCCSSEQHRKLSGKPFAPRVAVPVDMFPHTLHCELVLVFER
ncbi:tRNA (uracil(54)-C(5))-methyltransferase homolog-B [Clupea harengus]|uniref:tRNA (uracil(54)-C(5))-methyltransferase n=1 Tax=Clupea harengus TaxID=7950 RepID=A0A6P8GD77_CLUHA|nr:tRNA (uracil(54)-C(5))-methyltransferase homolog-B [Clupea harengus]